MRSFRLLLGPPHKSQSWVQFSGWDSRRVFSIFRDPGYSSKEYRWLDLSKGDEFIGKKRKELTFDIDN